MTLTYELAHILIGNIGKLDEIAQILCAAIEPGGGGGDAAAQLATTHQMFRHRRLSAQVLQIF